MSQQQQQGGGGSFRFPQEVRPVNVYEDFQRFMYTNDVVVAAAGFSIGAITKEFITTVLEEVVLPMATGLGSLLMLSKLRDNLQSRFHRRVLDMTFKKIGNVLWLMFVWLATIGLTFLILEYLLNMHIIGMRTHMSPQDERQFRQAKGLVQNQDSTKQARNSEGPSPSTTTSPPPGSFLDDDEDEE